MHPISTQVRQPSPPYVLAASIALALSGPVFADDVTRVTKSNWPKLFVIYSPDGSHFLYARHYPNRRASQQILTGLRVVRVDGSNDRPLMPDVDRSVQIQEHPAFGRDRKTLYLTGGGNDLGNAAKDTFVCEVTD
ncbi:MAG TPA: hypothetical protein VKI65_01720, partial [Gemmataceae bacterium]|nr:hypothetical protein [Gemmataceae bacterium]